MVKKKKMKMDFSTVRVKFVVWKRQRKDWKSWVAKMSPVHKSTWENAGIYEAIMSSTYMIERQDNLIFELASRWCSQTNTFVFPWGEASLTLEDMSVLGGFSSKGVSALSSLENEPEMLSITTQLELARLEIFRSKAKAAVQCKWIEKFKDSSNELEHAAFLSLWLSRYVFPVNVQSAIINKHVFQVAARLSRGIEVALGPVVLAMLYRDLSALSERLRFTLLVDHSDDKVCPTNLCGLFHLLQIWAWERFPNLQPVMQRRLHVRDFPRVARWSDVAIRNVKDPKSALDSAENVFLWRPYGSSSSRQCMDAVELLGFNSCIEKYQPRRVARQFGSDQDAGSKEVVDSVPPGFAPLVLIDSDSDSDFDDDDFSIPMTPEAQIKEEQHEEDDITDEDHLDQLKHSNSVSPYEVVEDSFSSDKAKESEKASAQIRREDAEDVVLNEKDQLQRSVFASPPSDHESHETMNVVNGSVHETREDGSESCASKMTENSGLDLEARISRLEDIVYAAI